MPSETDEEVGEKVVIATDRSQAIPLRARGFRLSTQNSALVVERIG